MIFLTQNEYILKLFKKIKQTKFKKCASNYTHIKILDIKEYLPK